MTVEPFRLEHVDALTLQPQQARWKGTVTPDIAEALERSGEAWTLLDAAGRVVGCGGTISLGGGRAEAWALLAHDAGRHMVAATRAVRRFLAATDYRRIEAVTAESFGAGGKWVKMLGFRFEGPMAAYCDNGEAAIRWAMVKD